MSVVALAKYLTRITPALALFGLTLLLWKSLASLTRRSQDEPTDRRLEPEATFWQWLLSIHLVSLHIVTALIPLRAVRALGHTTSKMRETAGKLSPLYSSNVALRFAIIIPAYKETTETLRTTLSVLAFHPQAQACYDIYIAVEEREKGSQGKAKCLQHMYRERFHSLQFTVHPQIAGEAPGKSSNQSWAAKQIIKDHNLLPSKIRPEVLVTTMDADSHLSWRYFAQMAEEHLALSNQEYRNSTIYIAPMVFDRNAHQVPALVRSADIFWTGAGISTMCAGSTTNMPTSVYTLPLTLLEDVGGWDTDYDAIGEDMHMYLKCFFALNGNLQSKVIYAAASQCNVCSDLKGLRGYVDGIRARYQQATRHMWGMLDSGFAIRLAVDMFGRRWNVWWMRLLGITARSLRQYGQRIVLSPCGQGKLDTLGPHARGLQPIHQSNIRTIVRRLVEAHLVPVQMAIALAVPTLFQAIWPNVRIPFVLATSLQVCGILRLLSLVIVVGMIRRYKEYYRVCVQLRSEDSAHTSKERLDGMEEEGEVGLHARSGSGLLEAAVSPFVGLLFGALPGLQATIMHLFTIRLTYIVSAKPLFAKAAGDINLEQGTEEGGLAQPTKDEK